MRKRSRAAGSAIIGSALLLAAYASVQAAEVRVLAVGSLPGALAQLGPQFEQSSGHKLIIEYGATPGLIKKIEAGEPFDVAILVADMMNDPSRQGLFATGARPAISSVGLGAAVRAGAPKPDIGSAEAFKEALIKAKSVAILPESVNGKHFMSVFERLGIGEQMKAKIKPQTIPHRSPRRSPKARPSLRCLSAMSSRRPRRGLCGSGARRVPADPRVRGRGRRQGQGACGSKCTDPASDDACRRRCHEGERHAGPIGCVPLLHVCAMKILLEQEAAIGQLRVNNRHRIAPWRGPLDLQQLTSTRCAGKSA